MGRSTTHAIEGPMRHMPSEEARSHPTIGGRSLDELSAGHQEHLANTLADLTGLRVPEHERISDRDVDAARELDRRLYFARPLRVDERHSFWRPWSRCGRRARRTRRDVATTEARRERTRGRARHLEREE